MKKASITYYAINQHWSNSQEKVYMNKGRRKPYSIYQCQIGDWGKYGWVYSGHNCWTFLDIKHEINGVMLDREILTMLVNHSDHIDLHVKVEKEL